MCSPQQQLIWRVGGGGVQTFLTQLARSFQASPSQLLLLQAKAGSVYANVALVPLPPATELNASAVASAVSVLGGLNGSALQLDPQFGTVSVLSLTQPFVVGGPGKPAHLFS